TVSDAPNAWKLDTYVMQIEAFEKKITSDFSALVAHPRNGLSYIQHTNNPLTDGYWGVAFIKTAAAQDISSFRLVAATDYSAAGSKADNQLMQGFNVLVSTDNGATWTVAGSVTDAVNKGEWTIVEATETTKGYAYIDVPAVATGVTHVAFAITQVSNHPTDANNRVFTMACEIELYK
ncbi:MAG: exo-alpha-sialidase, partial [Clostridia bacterium]|nr:exo-alpha-sialidase [Clostridia bacterium]